MEKVMLGFVCVFFTSALWPSLPHISLIGLGLLVLILCVWHKFSAIIAGALCAFLWSTIVAYTYTSMQVKPQLYNQTLIVEGEVKSIIPTTIDTHGPLSFTFVLDKIGNKASYFTPKVRLSWYQSQFPVQQGQRLRLLIKLKAPVGIANKHGFNYQKWLVSKNIVATAYVKQSPSNTILNAKTSLRQILINRLSSMGLHNEKWIRALMYGERSTLSKADWALMQTTGTAHLFAISGMHLGIVFGFCLLICKAISWLLLSVLRFSQIKIKTVYYILAASICAIYAWLSGFEIPVMRALISVFFVCILLALGKYWRLQASLLALLCIFFICFPFAHLGISFWFSFTAVCLIWFFLWRFPIKPASNIRQKLLYALKLQVFLSLATLPMIIIGFQSLPVVGLLANLIMIPIVTFVLVPLCLLAAFTSIVGYQSFYLLTIINRIFDYILTLLDWLNEFGQINVSSWQFSLSELILVLVLLVIISLPHWPYKNRLYCAVGLIITTNIVISSFIKTQNPNTWFVYVFDVGQGSAVVIETNGHYIIYDTGAKFRGGFSMANAVLLPFFESRAKPTIDTLILSHLDNDHAGGTSVLESSLDIRRTIQPSHSCFAGENFIWQGLKFELLWPLEPKSGEENNDSCVLKVSGAKHSILLTGDIEQPVEAALVKNYANTHSLQANIMLAPHHGSKTSSSLEFVQAVTPSFTVFTAGYNNRWGFPAQSVSQRYLNVGSTLFNTGLDGQITFTINESGITSSRYRTDEYRRWYFKTY